MPGQKRNRGRRQDADLDHIAADSEDSRCQRIFQHIARYARILTDDHDRPFILLFEYKGARLA